MPYSRPSLTQLRQQAAADITSGLPGADGLLRFSNLNVISTVVAGFANLQYGYLDWIAKQAVPFTCDDEFLAAWGALKNVFIIPASYATGIWTTIATNGVFLAAGKTLQRGDGVQYITTADAVAASGVLVAPVIAVAAGAAGNCDIGTQLTLGNTIPGVNTTGTAQAAFTGGADIEDQEAFRSRVLAAFAHPSQGGAADDYIEWALEVPGVTRAWILKSGQGIGTVVVYFMMDISEAAHGGFPQGSNGVATGETRDVAATGDQLAVANYIYGPSRQPVTALVYAVAPGATSINFTIASLLPNTTAMKTAIAAAITDCFTRLASPAGTVYMTDIQTSIAAIPGIIDFIITSPTTNVTTTTGNLPVLGTITWT